MTIHNHELLAGLPDTPNPLPDFGRQESKQVQTELANEGPARATAPECVGDSDFEDEESAQSHETQLEQTVPATGSLALSEAIEKPEADDQSPTDPPDLPPDSPGTSEAGEPKPAYIVLEGRGGTLAVSTVHPKPELVEAAAALLEDGLAPEGWTPAVMGIEGSSAAYLQDDPDNPQYFLKVHGNTSPIEEMEMTPLVQEVIDDPATQAIATEHGFSDITFVAPLLAGDVGSSNAFTVYEWVDGYHPAMVEPGNDGGEAANAAMSETARITEIAYKIYDLLEARGINPVDLTSNHLMVTHGPHGYRGIRLIDIAAFRHRHH